MRVQGVALLDDFCASKRVIDVAHHILDVQAQPWLVALVTWRGESEAIPRRRAFAARRENTEPDAPLHSDAQARYEALRQWRNQHARSTGKPPYLIFNNRQAVAIAQRAPTSLAELGEIDGIGSSKLEAWGAAVLKLLAGVTNATIGSKDPGGSTTGQESSGLIGEADLG